MNKHLDILNDLYCWFYLKYSNGIDINVEKLRRVSDKTITYYLEHDIAYPWNWDVDQIKRGYELHEFELHAHQIMVIK